MVGDEFPYEAEAFIAQVGNLPESVWREILAHFDWGISDWARVVKEVVGRSFGFGTAKPRLGKVTIRFSDTASKRLDELFMSGRVPTHLSWRVKPILSIAVNVLCSQATVDPKAIAAWYGPFERYIPLASLKPPTGQSTN